MSDEELAEKIITKVNSKGKKTRRKKCKRGYKLSSDGSRCERVSGRDKAKKKKAIRKAVRTKKAQGGSSRKRTTRKRLRALKKRKNYGL